MLTTYVQIMRRPIRQLTLDGMAGGRRSLVNERLRYSTGIMKRLSGSAMFFFLFFVFVDLS